MLSPNEEMRQIINDCANKIQINNHGNQAMANLKEEYHIQSSQKVISQCQCLVDLFTVKKMIKLTKNLMRETDDLKNKLKRSEEKCKKQKKEIKDLYNQIDKSKPFKILIDTDLRAIEELICKTFNHKIAELSSWSDVNNSSDTLTYIEMIIQKNILQINSDLILPPTIVNDELIQQSYQKPVQIKEQIRCLNCKTNLQRADQLNQLNSELLAKLNLFSQIKPVTSEDSQKSASSSIQQKYYFEKKKEFQQQIKDLEVNKGNQSEECSGECSVIQEYEPPNNSKVQKSKKKISSPTTSSPNTSSCKNKKKQGKTKKK